MSLLIGIAVIGVAASAAPTPVEVVVQLASGFGSIALSTRGTSAFRVRFLTTAGEAPIDTPMVAPEGPDANFEKVSGVIGTGIVAASIGSVLVSPNSELVLLDAHGKELTRSMPIDGGSLNDTCAAQQGTDITAGTRAGDPATVHNEAECCNKCKATKGCAYWIYGHPGDSDGNCWVMSAIDGTMPRSDRTLGTGFGPRSLVFSASPTSTLYGAGADKSARALSITGTVSPVVDNTRVFAPYYWSTDGYGCLGVVPESETTGSGKTNLFPTTFTRTTSAVTWTHPRRGKGFELYLMPATTLDSGTQSYYGLIGAPAVPPRYAFGFFASRWGWKDRAYIESMLQQFRDGQYPIDAMIGDFEWFTNISDYGFPPEGVSWYTDFGYGATTLPEPQQQFQSYREDRHIRFGGIRKPRLGNTALLNEARQKGFVLPGGEAVQYIAPSRNLSESPEAMQALHSTSLYAEQRNLNYSIPAAREWYVSHQQHYLSDGVSFFWNDEGETDYFTFYYWNMAQRQTLAAHNSTARFYSINRAWSPGMARLGATVWTGDINPSWDDLQSTPAMILRWGLAGAPYVACDIGGFTGETNGPLLTRWMQAGAFFPTMRVHSTLDAKPHFPFLWPEPYASRMRSALNQRYRLIAFHYSLAHVMHTTGRLWMRPLAAAFPNDPVVTDLTAQWLDGELLVAPILTSETEKSPAYLPEGLWYRFDTEPNQEGTWMPPIKGPTIDVVRSDDNFTAVPVYAPAGAIVPLVPLLQHTGALPGGPLEVRVYGGADGAFQMIEDDGETTDYATATAMRGTTFSWDEKARTLSWVVSRGAPSPPSMFTQLRLVLYQATGGPVISSNVVDIGASGSIVAP